MISGARSLFAQNLIKYRKQRGFSQGDLAETSGLSRRMIAHYETHVVQPPIEKIELLAKALGIKPSKLLEYSDNTDDLSNNLFDIDSRSIKKLRDILSLSDEDRNILYQVLNKLLRKNQLEDRERAPKKTTASL